MAAALSVDSLSFLPLDMSQGQDMECVLRAFVAVHKAAGAAATEGGFALLDLCQRAIVVVLNEIELDQLRQPWGYRVFMMVCKERRLP